ncbi:hypothetical protein [Aestuariirhabdus sp. LZHN29]|uniref:hypothetical protein n=1 Tax=Aestuariirhabdus sp. LZHN29 TaxID=3417462 RepID=UPI003CF39ED8
MNRLHIHFFPPTSRSFAGKRWIMIGLRTLHILGVAGAGAGFLLEGRTPDSFYLHLLLITGALMALIEVWSHGVWLLQLKGLSVTLKLGLIAAMLNWPAHTTPLFIAILILSGVFAHAPGYVRYYSPWHRRRLRHP